MKWLAPVCVRLCASFLFYRLWSNNCDIVIHRMTITGALKPFNLYFLMLYLHWGMYLREMYSTVNICIIFIFFNMLLWYFVFINAIILHDLRVSCAILLFWYSKIILEAFGVLILCNTWKQMTEIIRIRWVAQVRHFVG